MREPIHLDIGYVAGCREPRASLLGATLFKLKMTHKERNSIGGIIVDELFVFVSYAQKQYCMKVIRLVKPCSRFDSI